jgi:crossover junction endodeoxyribonuclease RuvC
VIVLGIDPGTANTGYGVVEERLDGCTGGRVDGKRLGGLESLHLIECGVIRTRARESLANRLGDIYEGVVELIERHKPDALCVEDVFYAKNVRTTVVLGHARGVVLLAGCRASLEIREIPPAEIKKAIVGTGAATKEQVQFMLTRLLRLKSAPQPFDAADGIAAAMAGLFSARRPSSRPVPVIAP